MPIMDLSLSPDSLYAFTQSLDAFSMDETVSTKRSLVTVTILSVISGPRSMGTSIFSQVLV